jgi:DME family drug/metabolite transporter
MATVLFFDGLGRIQASRAAIVSTVEPVVAALLATMLLGQGLTLVGWLGLGLVVVGVAGSYASDGPPRPADEEVA